MDYLTHKEIKAMFIGAYHKLTLHQQELNRLNLFPVPDKDTGNNFVKTLSVTYYYIKDKQFKDLKELNKVILDTTLNCACGNVGVIYLSFLSGFLPTLSSDKITKAHLGLAFQNGAYRARRSILDPKQGTILDVIDALAFFFNKIAKKETDIAKILIKTLPYTTRAVKETQNKIKIYTKNKIVDAGALGFNFTLHGFIDSLTKKHTQSFIKKPVFKNPAIKINILHNKYEVMVMLTNLKISPLQLKSKLAYLGDCLDIISIGSKTKIHIHTDYPDKIMEILKPVAGILNLSTINLTKKDNSKKEAIGLVTDESIDLPIKVIKKEKIVVVPFKVFMEDKLIKNKGNLYKLMNNIDRKSLVLSLRTSQPPPGQFLLAFKKQLAKHQQVICITISSALSGTYNSALQAGKILPQSEQQRIYIFDSLCGTGGQGLLTLKALDLIKQKYDIKDIICTLKKERSKIKIFGLTKNLNWLARGGRINLKLARTLNLLMKLGIRPVMGLKNHKIDLLKFNLGLGDITEIMFKEFKKQTKSLIKAKKEIKVIITHVDNLRQAQKLIFKIKGLKNSHIKVFAITETNSAIGVHVGPGTIFCSYTYN